MSSWRRKIYGLLIATFALAVSSCAASQSQTLRLPERCERQYAAALDNSPDVFVAICSNEPLPSNYLVNTTTGQVRLVEGGGILLGCSVAGRQQPVFCVGRLTARARSDEVWRIPLDSNAAPTSLNLGVGFFADGRAAEAGDWLCLREAGAPSFTLANVETGERRVFPSRLPDPGSRLLSCALNGHELTTLTLAPDSGLTMIKGERSFSLRTWSRRGLASLGPEIVVDHNEAAGMFEVYRLGEGFERIGALAMRDLPSGPRLEPAQFTSWASNSAIGYLWFESGRVWRLSFTHQYWELQRAEIGVTPQSPVALTGGEVVIGSVAGTLIWWSQLRWTSVERGHW